MNIWHSMSPKRINADDFVAVIEIAKGSKIKYELDKETGLIEMDRITALYQEHTQMITTRLMCWCYALKHCIP